MTIFLGHTTALRYWRSMRAHNKYGFPIARSSAQPGSVLSPSDERAAEEAEARARFCPHDEPLHVTAAAEGIRRAPGDTVYHVHLGAFPRRSFAAGPAGVFVSSPELCFLQMAEELDLPALVELGFELCGSYSMRATCEPTGKSERHFEPERPDGQSVSWFEGDLGYDLEAGSPLDSREGSGFHAQRSPLTSVETLRRFIGRCDGFRGVKKAREALKHVVNDAASPMESKLVMLLCLPRFRGGYGLPLPALNKRVDPRADKNWRAKKSFYRCDLMWPNGVVVEYDSRMWHSAAEKLEQDAIRRNDLAYMGAAVTCVTAGQVYSRQGMDKIAALLRKQLGIRVNEPRYDYVSRQQELRRALLGTRW